MNQNGQAEQEPRTEVGASALHALVMRCRAHYRDLAPHVKERRTAQLLHEATEGLCEFRQTARLAADELIRMADELKQSSTIGGHWDGTEEEAREEFDRLMSLAKYLSE